MAALLELLKPNLDFPACVASIQFLGPWITSIENRKREKTRTTALRRSVSLRIFPIRNGKRKNTARTRMKPIED